MSLVATRPRPALRRYGTGYTGSEAYELLTPPGWRRDASRRAVVFCHGGGGLAYTWSYYLPQLEALAVAGHPVISTDMGGDTWGNDTGQTRVGQSWTFAQTAFGAKTDKMILVGDSMGGAVALNYAMNNPSNVSAIALTRPVIGLDDIHDNNRGGFQSAINTAYTDSTTWESVKGTHDPSLNTSTHNTNAIPTRIWSGQADTKCLWSIAQTFDAAVGSCDLAELVGEVDHGVTKLSGTDLVAFLAPYAA